MLTSASTPIALSPSAHDLLLEGLGRLGMRDVVDDDVRPLPGELQHDRHADAAVAAGDDGDFSFETHASVLLIEFVSDS